MAYSPMLPVRCFPGNSSAEQIRFVHEKIQIGSGHKEDQFHQHLSLSPYYEIIFFLQGNREIIVGDQNYSCVPGDIIFFNPEEPRAGFNLNLENYDWFHLYIYPDALAPFAEYENLMRCFIGRPYCRANRFSLPEDARAEITSLFLRAEGAYSESELFCGTYLLQILLRLNRILPQRDNLSAKGSRPELLQKILTEISETPEDLPTVTELTQKYSISHSGLWRLFHSHLNISPQQYIQLRRLAYAKQLILSGVSVTEACMRSGFGECSRLIACFRASYGITPLQYQKQNHIR